MPKARNSKIDEALAMYRQGLKLIEISHKLDIPEGTVRRWKCTYKWDEEKTERSDQTSERSEPEKPNVRKRGAQPGNKNGKGAPRGNKNGKGAPVGNTNAEKFGFYTKYLPEETLEIFGEIENADPLDLLWDQIRFSYTAILRAQKIAYVKDAEDKTVETSMEGYSDSGSTTAWDIQQAWDKQANFMKAQARAMDTLRSLIKQYDEMLHKDWDAATEEQKARLQALRTKINDGADQVGKVVIINDTNDPHQ